jgi:hypothetical protein
MEPYRTLTDGTQVFIKGPPPRDPYADYRERETWRAYAILPDGSKKDLPGRGGWAGQWHDASEARMWAKAWADAREADHART